MSAAAAVRVEDHLGLVARLAWKHRCRWMEYDDLYQEGMVGLLEAARRYDPAFGVKFATFAHRRVEGAILDALRAGGSLISIPRARQEALRDGAPASDLDARAGRARLVRHEAEFGGRPLGWAVDPGSVPARDPYDPILMDAVNAALAGLTPRQRAVLEALYPRDGGAPERFAAIAARLGCSVSRVFRLRVEAVQGLRAALCVPSPADTPHPGESPMIATNGPALPGLSPGLSPDPAPAGYTCPHCKQVFRAQGRHDCRGARIPAPTPRPAPPAPAAIPSPGILGELDAMRAVVQALDGFDAAAARRVLDWVAAHYREARP